MIMNQNVRINQEIRSFLKSCSADRPFTQLDWTGAEGVARGVEFYPQTLLMGHTNNRCIVTMETVYVPIVGGGHNIREEITPM